MTAIPKLAISSAATDADLVGYAKGGDRDARRILMRRHNRAAFRTARAILRDDADAEDALQEAWLRVFRKLDGFRGESKFSTWLIRIVANEALMRRRRVARHAEIFPIDASENASPVPEEATMPEDGPERAALRGEVRRFLESRIDALPDLYRAVFVLRAVEELSVEETAAAL